VRPILLLKVLQSVDDKAPLALDVAVGMLIVIVVLEEFTAISEPVVPVVLLS